MAFVKLDTGILDSTLWLDRDLREVFITALLMAQPCEFSNPMQQIEVSSLQVIDFFVPPGWYGFVPAAGMGIINRAGVAREAGMEALRKLGCPENESRSNDFDGRRMVRVDGGYAILNYFKYRDHDYTAADRMKRLRQRRKGATVTPNGDAVTPNNVTVTPNAGLFDDQNSADVHPNVTQAEYRVQSTEVNKYKNIPSTAADQEAAIYQAYPRKVGRDAAEKAIRKAVERLVATKHSGSASAARGFLYQRTILYAKSPCGGAPPKGETDYRPYPATWFNKGRYLDDMNEWERGNWVVPQKVDPLSKMKFINGGAR